MLNGSIGYTSDLTKYVVEHAKESDAIAAQLEDPATDIFTGLPFQEAKGDLDDAGKAEELRSYISTLSDTDKAALYVKMMSVPTEEELSGMVAQAVDGKSREEMEAVLSQAMTQQMRMSEDEVSSYLSSMDDEELKNTYTQAVTEQVKALVQTMADAFPGGMLVFDAANRTAVKMIAKTWLKSAKIQDVGAYFAVSDAPQEISAWDSRLQVTSRGYMLGYNDLKDPSVSGFFRFLAKIGDGMMKMQIVKIGFGGKQ